MPELPEVQTIVTDLRKVLPGLIISGFWTDTLSFKKPAKEASGRKILFLKRRGKNILIHLSGNLTLLIHQKMTGHLLYGLFGFTRSKWVAAKKGPLRDDPQNRFIHLIFNLSNGRQLALSDLRKFAKVLAWPTDKLDKLPDISNIGPEPLDANFNFNKFQAVLKNRRGKIKQILMNQEIIAGIGNIYSDEILWEAGLHPLSPLEKLDKRELRRIFNAMEKVLKKGIEAKGDSMSDYRRPSGEKGGYQKIQNAYHMAGTRCKKKDGGIIKRIKIAGRSAHFCPVHQR